MYFSCNGLSDYNEDYLKICIGGRLYACPYMERIDNL